MPLGLITEDGSNEHLDTLEGRVWMRLEWRALRRAVESSGSDRAEAIADALAFRRERRGRFPGAADNERREEIREGLASRSRSPNREATHSSALIDGSATGIQLPAFGATVAMTRSKPPPARQRTRLLISEIRQPSPVRTS